MYTLSVRATELERSYPYGIVRQTADSVALDKSDEERAALFTGAAQLALPILDPGQRGGRRQPRADVPAPARALLADREPRARAPAPDHASTTPSGPTRRRWRPSASSACGSRTCRWCCCWRCGRPRSGQLAVPLAEILADPATVSIRPGPLSDGGRRRSASRRCSERRDAGLRGRLPPRHGRQPVPARAARERDPRRGHRAHRRERRAAWRRSAPTRCAPRCCCGSSGCRAPAGRWRARWRSSGEHDVALRDVATLAEVPEDAAAEALAELERAGLVTGAPRLRFTHPILRAAIEDDMPAVERSRAHEQAARMLADRDADPVAVAAHLLVSEPGPGRRGRIAALRARRAPRRGARRPVGRGALPRARRGRAARRRRARRDPVRARPRGRPRRRPRRGRAPRARRGGGRPDAAARAALDGVLHLVAGRASKAADVLEAALADVHEEDEAAKPLLETLIAAGLESATVRAAPRRHLRPPRGAARRAADRLRALRADHARVRLRGRARGRRRAPTSSSTGRSRSRSTATTSP